MAIGAPLPVREFGSADELRTHYATVPGLRRTPPRPVARMPVMLLEDPRAFIAEAAERDRAAGAEAMKSKAPAVDLDAILEVAPTPLPPTAEQRNGALLRGTDCLRIVAQVTGIPESTLKGPMRPWPVVKARQIAAWLLVNVADKSGPVAGQFLGGRDHSTIFHACRRVDGLSLPVAVWKGDTVDLVRALWALPWPDNLHRIARDGAMAAQAQP